MAASMTLQPASTVLVAPDFSSNGLISTKSIPLACLSPRSSWRSQPLAPSLNLAEQVCQFLAHRRGPRRQYRRKGAVVIMNLPFKASVAAQPQFFGNNSNRCRREALQRQACLGYFPKNHVHYECSSLQTLAGRGIYRSRGKYVWVGSLRIMSIKSALTYLSLQTLAGMRDKIISEASVFGICSHESCLF